MIDTDRLTLRPYTLADFDAYLAMVTDPCVYATLGGKAMSAEDAWNRLLRYAGHWSVFGYGLFAVVERTTGRYLGETGIAHFHRGLGPHFDSVGEAAWVFTSASHGHGYAAEAATAAHLWYDTNHAGARTVCLIAPDNAPSLKLAEKLDYTAFGETDYRTERFLMLERTA